MLGRLERFPAASYASTASV
jgi:hypothetical protein